MNFLHYTFIYIFSVLALGSDGDKTVSTSMTYMTDVMEYLTADEQQGRATGTEGVDRSATFIAEQLKTYGVEPFYDTYRDNFDVDGELAFNVVGVLKGNDPELSNEYVMIGAHYDHVGIAASSKRGNRSTLQDSIFNGANDNASGTAAVLELARYYGKERNNKRSIIFALFAAEERGLRGSRHLAGRMKDQELAIYTMINFEMIGVPFKDRDYTAFVSGYDVSNIAEIMNAYSGKKLIGASEVSKKYSLFQRSDNYAFYTALNIPSHTISSCDLTNYDYYHHADDEIEQIDYQHMAKLVNDLIPAISGILNSKDREIQLITE